MNNNTSIKFVVKSTRQLLKDYLREVRYCQSRLEASILCGANLVVWDGQFAAELVGGQLRLTGTALDGTYCFSNRIRAQKAADFFTAHGLKDVRVGYWREFLQARLECAKKLIKLLFPKRNVAL